MKNVKLEHIGRFQSGGTPSRSNPYFFNGHTPWITTVSLGHETVSHEDAVEYITKEAIEKSATKVVPENSILIGTRVGVGKTSINKCPICTNQDIIAICNIDESLWDKRYIVKYLLSQNAYFNTQKRGATIQGIKLETLKNIQIPLPPLPVQRRIADTLDAAQALIDRRKQQIALMDEYVRSVFLDMFGDPVSNPKGWMKKKIEHLSEFLQNGLYVEKEFYCQTGCKMIHMSDAFYGAVDSRNLKKVNIDIKTIKKYSVDENDILIARRSLTIEGAAKPCLVPKHSDPIIFESSLIRIKTNRRIIHPFYLYYFMSDSKAKQHYINRYITKSTISGIKQSSLNEVEILVPPLKLQDCFYNIVSSVEIIKKDMNARLNELENCYNSIASYHFNNKSIL